MKVKFGMVDRTSLSLDLPITRPRQHGAAQGIPVKGLLSICSGNGVEMNSEHPDNNAPIIIIFET
jgi:hypothetical protein